MMSFKFMTSESIK